MPGPLGGGPLGMSMRFHVLVDGISLGSWSSCKGLELSCKLHKIREPGSYDFEKILFADIEYSSIKLERAMDSSSKTLQTWLSTTLKSQPGALATTTVRTATITLLDAAWTPVTSWTLRGVYPKAWSGPTMRAEKSGVAIETLELAHEGFL